MTAQSNFGTYLEAAGLESVAEALPASADTWVVGIGVVLIIASIAVPLATWMCRRA